MSLVIREIQAQFTKVIVDRGLVLTHYNHPTKLIHMETLRNPNLITVFNSIWDHIKYSKPNFFDKESGFVTEYNHLSFTATRGKRTYKALIQGSDTFINLGIFEDANTRTVFSGKIYTMEQFLLIDQLT